MPSLQPTPLTRRFASLRLPLLLLTSACAPQAAGPSEAPPPPKAEARAASPESSAPPSPAGVALLEDGSGIHPAVRAAVAAKDRSEEDLALDEQRLPELLFAFYDVVPDMRVAELAAGKGYTSELLSRIVGPKGQVYVQNNRFILEKFAEEPLTSRLKSEVMNNAVRLDTELDAPFPDEVTQLDAVFMILFYHDTVWFGTDRAKMNRAVYEALKSGGIYGIVDHSAREGDGVTQAKTLHRIEESVVKEEILAAGFVLADEAEFLGNDSDARDWNASPSAAGERRGTSDRFVLKFKKP